MKRSMDGHRRLYLNEIIDVELYVERNIYTFYSIYLL